MNLHESEPSRIICTNTTCTWCSQGTVHSVTHKVIQSITMKNLEPKPRDACIAVMYNGVYFSGQNLLADLICTGNSADFTQQNKSGYCKYGLVGLGKNFVKGTVDG